MARIFRCVPEKKIIIKNIIGEKWRNWTASEKSLIITERGRTIEFLIIYNFLEDFKIPEKREAVM